MNFHDRLKSERVRLGFSQTDFAAVANASKHAQINWEKGIASPNAAALVAWSGVGVDVLFLLTGVPKEAHAILDSYDTAKKITARIEGSRELTSVIVDQIQGPKLTPEERQLIDAFREAPFAVQKAAIAALLSAQALPQ